MKNDFNKNKNWNNQKWDKKDADKNKESWKKETSGQESSMGKYVREEDTQHEENMGKKEHTKR